MLTLATWVGSRIPAATSDVDKNISFVLALSPQEADKYCVSGIKLRSFHVGAVHNCFTS